MEHLQKKIHQNGISYTLVGDYYIPDLKLPEESRPIGTISCGIPFIRALTWSFGRTRRASAPTPMTLSPVRIGRSSRAATKRL